MADETGFENIDADEHKDTPVVVRCFGEFWGICHAKGYQNAFSSSFNQFKTREEAVKYAEDYGCVVEKHSNDPLQDY